MSKKYARKIVKSELVKEEDGELIVTAIDGFTISGETPEDLEIALLGFPSSAFDLKSIAQ